MGILWGSYLESYRISLGILLRILWEFFGDPIENPMGILWGSYGNYVGILWGLCGNVRINRVLLTRVYCISILMSKKYNYSGTC